MNRLTWIGFLIAATVYTIHSTIRMHRERHDEIIRKLRPFRRAFRDGYLVSEMNVPTEGPDAS